jgi:hypothetical protein
VVFLFGRDYRVQVKKRHIEKIFTKLNMEIRSTTHNYGWFTVEGKKILRVHYSHGRGDIPAKVTDKIGVGSNFGHIIYCAVFIDIP